MINQLVSDRTRITIGLNDTLIPQVLSLSDRRNHKSLMDVQLLSKLDFAVDKFTECRTIESCSNFILERK